MKNVKLNDEFYHEILQEVGMDRRNTEVGGF